MKILQTSKSDTCYLLLVAPTRKNTASVEIAHVSRVAFTRLTNIYLNNMYANITPKILSNFIKKYVR